METVQLASTLGKALPILGVRPASYECARKKKRYFKEMTTESVTAQAKVTNTESSTGLPTTQTSTVTKVTHSILSTQIQSTNGLSTTVVYPRETRTEPVTPQAKDTNTESSTGLPTTQTSTVTKVIHSVLTTEKQSTNDLSTTVVYPREQYFFSDTDGEHRQRFDYRGSSY
ncbi:hypothetical protein OS493_036626 [Desmophyllum pertusum]|uniref:Uncharacterized protein n=1 Tax=Desmophyllum pertusum TaxID=174260 RepID=A0A9X0CU55_9CNID|nr:hypothetical protein OS493_036626 [Desmophyllum pertusum]